MPLKIGKLWQYNAKYRNLFSEFLESPKKGILVGSLTSNEYALFIKFAEFDPSLHFPLSVLILKSNGEFGWVPYDGSNWSEVCQ